LQANKIVLIGNFLALISCIAEVLLKKKIKVSCWARSLLIHFLSRKILYEGSWQKLFFSMSMIVVPIQSTGLVMAMVVIVVVIMIVIPIDP